MSIHQREVHPEYIEGCFMCRVSTVSMHAGDAKSGLEMGAKKVEKELDLYRKARKQGIQPDSTKTKDIQKAIEVSNKTGHAYGSKL
jgi:hypothetical protein